MKKIFFSFLVSMFLVYASSANTLPDITKAFKDKDCQNEQKKHSNCDECSINEIEDDEYCFYNQCYFDKQYREMKKILCLTKNQETKIDNIYRNFKTDYECLYNNHRVIKNKLLELISCNGCKKDINIQKNRLKDNKKDLKVKFQDYKDDLKEELCKSQRKDMKRFFKKEKRKMKRLAKYAVIYKFPCSNCCNHK